MKSSKKQKPDDDGTCHGCICAVQAVLEFDIGDGHEEFDQGFGDLLDDLHDALAAIHRARREQFTSKHDEIANTWEAATKLVRIAAAVNHAIHRGRELPRACHREADEGDD
jgi:hypothetical protein